MQLDPKPSTSRIWKNPGKQHPLGGFLSYKHTLTSTTVQCGRYAVVLNSTMRIYHCSPKLHVCYNVRRLPNHHPVLRLTLQGTFAPASESSSRRCACKTPASLREPGLQSANQLSDLKDWLAECHDVIQSQIKLELSAGLYSSTEDFRVTQNVQAGDVSLRELPVNAQRRIPSL
jgi:hypothetical protein